MGAPGVDAAIDMIDARESYKQEKKKIQTDIEAERRRVALEKKKEGVQKGQHETKQRNLLKRALATQRSRYGAGGTAGKSRSETSVFQRFKSDTKRNLNEYDALSDLRLERLNNQLRESEENALMRKKKAKKDQTFKYARAGKKMIEGGK